MTRKMVHCFMLFALVIVGLVGTASAQVLPISERVRPKYQITVKIPERATTITLVMNTRVDSGITMQNMRDLMADTVKKTCTNRCDGAEMDRIKSRVMQEALRHGINASHVTFE